MTVTAARRAFERRMTQTCKIEAPAGHRALDTETLTPTSAPTVLYAGRCSLATLRSGQGRDRGYGDFVESIDLLRLPADTAASLPPSSVVTLTDGPGIGTRWELQAEDIRTVALARTFRLARLTPLEARSVPA